LITNSEIFEGASKFVRLNKNFGISRRPKKQNSGIKARTPTRRLG